MSRLLLHIFNTGKLVVNPKKFYQPEIIMKNHCLQIPKLSIPVFAFLAVTEGERVLFDAGLSQRNPMGHGLLGLVTSWMYAPSPSQNIQRHLEVAGIEYLDKVVFSHLHADHVTGALELKVPVREGFYAHPEAIEKARTSKLYPKRFLKELRMKEIKEGYVNLPGHSTGHIGLHLGDVALVGDAIESCLSLQGETSDEVQNLARTSLLLASHDFNVHAFGNFMLSKEYASAKARQKSVCKDYCPS